MVEYEVFEIPLTLTNNDISAIITAYRSRACTIKETSSDSKGNSYQVYLILQGYTKQYAIAPNVDDAGTVIKNALIRVGAASGVASLNDANIQAAVDNMAPTTPDDIEGPWADVSAEAQLVKEGLEELQKLKQQLKKFDTAYRMLVKADKTPMATVLVVPKTYSPIQKVAAKSAEFPSIPSDIAGYDVIAITGDVTDQDVDNLVKLGITRIIYNSLSCYNKVIGTPPEVITVTANYLEYHPDLGATTVEFIDKNGITVLAVDPNKLSDKITTIVNAVTPTGDVYPVVFGCNVNNYPMIWDLVGFGIKYPVNRPKSYDDNDVVQRGIKIHNFLINVIPEIGWGPLETKVHNVTIK